MTSRRFISLAFPAPSSSVSTPRSFTSHFVPFFSSVRATRTYPFGALPMFPFLKVSFIALFRIHLEAELFQLRIGQGLRCFHHGRLAAARHREGLHLAQHRLAGEVHDSALDAGRDAAVRRRAVAEGAEHVPDALLELLAREAHHLVHRLEYLRLVCADGAAAGFEAVADEVVLRRQYLADAFALHEPFYMFGNRHRKRI